MKHTLADAELFCPARRTARVLSRRNVTSFHYRFRHPAVGVACARSPCNAHGAPHTSDVRFWFSTKDAAASVRTAGELALAHNMSGALSPSRHFKGQQPARVDRCCHPY